MRSAAHRRRRPIGRLGRTFTLDELARGLVLFDIISAIVTGLEWLFGQIVDIATAIGAVLLEVWRAISPIFGHVWGALRGVWDSALRPFLNKIEKWIGQLRAWWDRWAKPVTDLLAKIIKYERLIYDATIGPILATITTLQKLLTLLHLDRTKIGKALSKALSTAYKDLNGVWQLLTSKLNDVINTIQGWILDVDGFFQYDILVKSTFKQFKGIWNVWWYKTLPQLSPEGAGILDALKLPKPISQTRADFHAAVTGGSHPWELAYAKGREVLDTILAGGEPDVTPPDQGVPS